MSKELTLTQQEYEDLFQIMSQFRKKNQKMEEIEKKLNELQKEWNSIEKEIEEVRKEEQKLINNLIEKYGSGKLNTQTLKYELE